MTAASSGAAAAAAHRANAIKAAGPIVELTPEGFLHILELHEAPLVVHTPPRMLDIISRKYLTSYKGFCFWCRTPAPLNLPAHCEIIEAEKVWLP